MSYAVIRGAAHANAMRADKMRALAVRLAAPLEQLVGAACEATSPGTNLALAQAHDALAAAREAGVLP